METNFIELNRTFLPISKDHTFNEEAYDFSHLFGLTGTKKWSNLLALPRVIILAEAGAGKTDEVKAVARQLHSEGKAAFFLRLEDLASNFDIAFEEKGTLLEFTAWLKTKTFAWFFLDSVDESRLSDPKQFRVAIKQFASRLGDQKHRAHIFITSRISEWRAQSDLALIQTALPFEERIKSEQEQPEENINLSSTASERETGRAHTDKILIEPEIFALCPLDDEQQKTFSQAHETPNINDFLTAIDHSHAEVFAGRPQDLFDLILYWKQHQTISNRAKLIAQNIQNKLIETDPDRASILPLTPEEARSGAEELAAAVTFLQKSRILVPEQNPDSLIKRDAIDLQNFSTWEPNKIRALLQRPIFDKAVYGCVRFHHRSVREYLTAQWLFHLLQKGKSRPEIEALFFKSLYGQLVLIPSMRPILSWLILDDDKIREKAIDIAPEICLEGGDPSELPVTLRAQLLAKFCRHYAEQRRWGFSFDLSEARRFAHPDLGETINGLLADYRLHESIRALLLRIVWQGGINVCAEKALEFALNDSNDNYTRSCGIRSVGTAGSRDQKEQLVNTLLNSSVKVQKELAGELISAFAPNYLSIENILTLIKGLPSPEVDAIQIPLDLELREYSLQRCPHKDLLRWCEGLLLLLGQPPFIERRYFRLSEKNGWLFSFAVLAIERLVRAKHRDALHRSAIKIIALAQNAVHFFNYRSNEHRLKELVPKWHELNQALFWFEIKTERAHWVQENKGPLVNFWDIHIGDHYWQFSEPDFEKILSEIRLKSKMDDRLVALSLAFELYKEGGRGRRRRDILKKAVRGQLELEKRLHNLLNPPPMSAAVKCHRRSMTNFEQQQKQQQRQWEKDRKEKQKSIQTNISSLRDVSIAAEGRLWNTTSYLLHRLQKAQRPASDWETLIPEFGKDVAEAYRDGCISYWRRYRPKVLSENPEFPNKIIYAVTVGLSGIEIEAKQTQNWPNDLSEEEVKLACRYVFKEGSRFPSWMQKLHTVFPRITEMMLLKEIAWEFSQYDGSGKCHYMLSRVAYGPDWLKPRLANPLLPLLRDNEPRQNDTLDNAFRLLLECPELDQALFVEIAKAKIEEVSTVSRQALWFAAWMCIEATGAVEKLEAVLQDMNEPEEASQLSMQFIVALLGERPMVLHHRYQNFKRPDILLSLIKLMPFYICPSEDLDWGGAVLNPGLRVNAQDARDRLFTLLRDIPGKSAYLAIRDLSRQPQFADKKEWYLVSAKRRAEADAENEPWAAENIAQFSKDAEHTPQNHRELFDLSVSRLLDLKAELEDGNTSTASLLQKVEHENELRNYIADWLKQRGKGWYNIAQEDELPDATKPDLHINGSGFEGSVPIELKIAENSTGPVLFERLKNQLCGQYLRDRHSNCGIYLLVLLGRRDQTKKHWKHPETQENLDFVSLLKSLKVEAQDICTKDEKIESIEIIGIDLGKRIGSQ